MRIVFFGTPSPAAEILKSLISSKHEILAVVTQPDRPKGRGQKMTATPVKALAFEHSLPVEQPEKLKNNSAFKARLASLQPDIAVVVAYGKLIPPELLSMPKHGFINVHAALLPKYRGAAPIQWALLKGEKETGVTIMRIDATLDTGDILLQEKVGIKPEDDVVSLFKKIFAAGGALLLKALQKIETGEVSYSKQNEAEASFAPALSRESGEIDWKKSAETINNQVRALLLWPGAHTFYHGQMVKILKAKVVDFDRRGCATAPVGEIVTIKKKVGFTVVTGEGFLQILQVQPAGKNAMGAYDFVIGYKLAIGDVLPS
jgi:methionyl-tRNA formyltransferase